MRNFGAVNTLVRDADSRHTLSYHSLIARNGRAGKELITFLPADRGVRSLQSLAHRFAAADQKPPKRVPGDSSPADRNYAARMARYQTQNWPRPPLP